MSTASGRKKGAGSGAGSSGGSEELPLFAQFSSPAPSAPTSPKYWTITELTARIRGTLEPAFQEVWVQGEVSNYRPNASGHAYFSLKDAGSTIPAAIFGWSTRRKPPFELKDGLSLLCRGKLSVYAPRGGYQLVIDQVEPVGAGALQLAFEQLKTRLAAEGLFDPRRKRPLPPYPARIAVVTSPSGAAIRDMLNILARRAPHLQVTIVPALVQGEEAPRQLVRGLEVVNRCQLGEIVVLARGGGSIEDLWAFNDEALARAIAASRIPVVSAVGHEIDFTIADFVADLRAPTPSAAAEIVTSQWVETVRRLREASERMRSAIFREVTGRRRVLELLAARVIDPRDRLRDQMQRCDELSQRLERAMRVRLERRKAALEQAASKLDVLSPLQVLGRGYSIVRNAQGRVLRDQAEAEVGDSLQILLREGSLTVSVKGRSGADEEVRVPEDPR
jgi:exodeoxyribonuclease VII large subunit